MGIAPSPEHTHTLFRVKIGKV
ncbi:hypothetical protein CCACVL1_08334 [Corchorus capsularis]|uniref:Uncharacterized protein n=1 Tax=Corchorus capsularis TaxID=210143 RepID=A0A1R3J104_COCAP|nr:hypothetical protein CCACVL1_08334 [Corchorus capsularis]